MREIERDHFLKCCRESLGLLCRFAPAALPWSFGAFVFLTSLLDLSGGSNAQEFADWLGGVGC